MKVTSQSRVKSRAQRSKLVSERIRGIGNRKFLVDLYRDLCAALDTPTSLGCYLRLKYNEDMQLVDKVVDPYHYLNPNAFYRDYQASEYLKKYDGLRTGLDTRFEAMKKFIAAEDQCFVTNKRFRNLAFDPSISGRDHAILHLASRKIAMILGPLPNYDRIDFRFGPGASLGVRGETSVFNKLNAEVEATASMLPILSEFLGEFPGWIDVDVANVNVVSGSELSFVPKNAKTDRAICIEPLLNGLYQKGFGSYMRNRLRKFGIDLDTQERNQLMARTASKDGTMATVDLSSASDCISYGLVLHLLPNPWFQTLDLARCSYYKCEGSWYPFQKFSSMGNGYTFELESLIFYAIAQAVTEINGLSSDVGVYGDDLIVDTNCVNELVRVLEVCGFTTNVRKTFLHGPFRESCGADFFFGHDVRPLYHRTAPKKALHLYKVINDVSRIARKARHGSVFGAFEVPISPTGDAGRCIAFRDLHSRLCNIVPSDIRHLGPEGYGDGHIVSSWDEARPSAAGTRNIRVTTYCESTDRHVTSLVQCTGWEGWLFRSFCEQSILTKRNEWPLSYSLYFAGMDAEASLGYAIRNRCRTKEVTMISAPLWGAHGQWS